MQSQLKKTKRQILWEYVEAIVTALILALIIRAFVIQAFKIPTGSMDPTLLVGDHVLVSKFIYGTKLPFSDRRFLILKQPKKGDIIVFRYPEDPKRDFIKRVVATEGDKVESRDKSLFVNDRPVNEPYAAHTDSSIKPGGGEPRDNFGPYTVPKQKLFVMGDNRDQSYDSRYWGYVDVADVRGEAFIIYWSWDGHRHLPRLGRMTRIVR